MKKSLFGLFVRFTYVSDDGKKEHLSENFVCCSFSKKKLLNYCDHLNIAERIRRKITGGNFTITEYFVKGINLLDDYVQDY